MKTIITKNLFALSFIALMLALGACSKYEDGPWISFRSVEDRIIGKWKVEYFEIDGVDVTQQWIDNYNWTFNFFTNEYSLDHELWVTCISCSWASDTMNDPTYTFWKLSDDGRNLSFGIFDYNISISDSLYCGIYPLETCRYIEYKIQRLTMDEFWISHENDGHNYLIKLRII